MSYIPTIGLEVHAELNTKSKMFCGCKNDPHHGEPNAYICPVCMAHPGTLPVPNEQAVEMVFLFGRAVEAKFATYSEFDRKNYFYPDIPKAYQISQYAYPFLTGGSLEGVELTRVHLEEDTARSQHDKGEGSLVDFNRSGVPLMELVTEPVIRDAETAGRFARELQLLLRTIGISNANMERGEMRVEANISVSKDGGTSGTKVEVKNLNSFKSVEAAINYEVARQIEAIEAGKEIIQETRGWDEVKLRTFSQRSKETAKDYRYFPDPDIPKIVVDEKESFSTSLLDEKMPTLPSKKRLEYENLGLPRDTVEVLISNQELDSYFAQYLFFVKSSEASADLSKLGANYLVSDVTALISSTDSLSLGDLSVEYYFELMSLLQSKKLGSRVVKDLLPRLFSSDLSPLQIAEKESLLQVVDVSAIKSLVEEVVAENTPAVEEYKSGKDAAVQFLVGQGMKKSRGAADPALLREELLKALK